ncbi:MAG TPA: DEAD/DEAH box helicase family protein [Thermoanaerobaculia bacterium]|jgi:type III restriction enzyme|nr:DEAD/DEAH box helicase family protein [Thermoanaerobaculia bacterium]
MNLHEVSEPILCSPYEEPKEHWEIREGEPAIRQLGRRPAVYYYRPPSRGGEAETREGAGTAIELRLVNRIRERVKAWREEGYPGVTRTTADLLAWWRRPEPRVPLFFAQIEAVETILFLVEARADFRQGIEIPWDEPSEDRQKEGINAFRRYACKMATGTGKTTVMAMLAAWSILNKVNDRGDSRFSDAVLVVCPNVTIRNRLAELDPRLGEASLYRTRDLVPSHLMPQLTQGRVLVTNWHVFEPQTSQVGGVSAKVAKTGRRIPLQETIRIGARTTTARGSRYMTLEQLRALEAAGQLEILERNVDEAGHLVSVKARSERWVESDRALVQRVLGRDLGEKGNLLVFNDEAHHAYRIRPEAGEEDESLFDEEERSEDEENAKEATVWVEGLDRIHKLRKVNFCVDLSATPYFLGRVGQATHHLFPWVVSDFGLTDAIESGLVKVPQLAVRDSTGSEVPGYFNIWRWILRQLTPAERGGKRSAAKPEAVLKYANTPIVMLGGMWGDLAEQWAQTRPEDPRPPVFILVAKNTKIAKVLFDWLALDQPPPGVPPARLPWFRNVPEEGREVTIRVDSKVVHETDSGEAKSDEMRWMRLTLDTVGRIEWPKDREGRPIYPEGFEELAAKLRRPLHPPGRDVRCIVSVGMLTEGWDCNTVTHIVGLRPFMSQLLCEQVVGRGLRRTSYEVGADGKLSEEVAKVFGVPFEVIPFKQNPAGPAPPPSVRHHVRALPEKARYEIRFPRVEGYAQAVRNRLRVEWETIARLRLDPMKIPPEVEVKASLPSNTGRPSLYGPGRLESLTLNPYRKDRRLQALAFEMARDLTRAYVDRPTCEVPAHVLFPQLAQMVRRYLDEKVVPIPPAEKADAFLSPYYGWIIETLLGALHPDTSQGEAPEVPVFERHRGPGTTAEVDFWTKREVREVNRCHLNYMVADTGRWEQSAAEQLDRHPRVEAFVKNAGLGFAIPYLYNGQPHEYQPDFLVRLAPGHHLILEVKGFDPLEEVKIQAAHRWVSAVNADGTWGRWDYRRARTPGEVAKLVEECAAAEIASSKPS